MKLVVVFDTSVLFSAIGWGGKPGQCVQFARDGRIDGMTCTEILNELGEKLAQKLGFTDEQIVETIGSLQLFLRPVTITGGMAGLCPDPKDDMVLGVRPCRSSHARRQRGQAAPSAAKAISRDLCNPAHRIGEYRRCGNAVAVG